MTTCVNQEKKGYAGKAVSATLAGVLAVGMVPASALAAVPGGSDVAEDAGVETLATTAVSFAKGELTFSNGVNAQTYEYNGSAQGLRISKVTPPAADVIEVNGLAPSSISNAEKETAYYKYVKIAKKDTVNDNAKTGADGTAITYTNAKGKTTELYGDFIDSTPVNAGEYAVVACYTKDGKTWNYTNTAGYFVIDGTPLSEATLFDGSDVTDTTFEYTGEANSLVASTVAGRIGVAINNIALTDDDVTVEIWNKGGTTQLTSTELTPGTTYVAKIKGVDGGTYDGQVQDKEFTIEKLNLSTAVVEGNAIENLAAKLFAASGTDNAPIAAETDLYTAGFNELKSNLVKIVSSENTTKAIESTDKYSDTSNTYYTVGKTYTDADLYDAALAELVTVNTTIYVSDTKLGDADASAATADTFKTTITDATKAKYSASKYYYVLASGGTGATLQNVELDDGISKIYTKVTTDDNALATLNTDGKNYDIASTAPTGVTAGTTYYTLVKQDNNSFAAAGFDSLKSTLYVVKNNETNSGATASDELVLTTDTKYESNHKYYKIGAIDLQQNSVKALLLKSINAKAWTTYTLAKADGTTTEDTYDDKIYEQLAEYVDIKLVSTPKSGIQTVSDDVRGAYTYEISVRNQSADKLSQALPDSSKTLSSGYIDSTGTYYDNKYITGSAQFTVYNVDAKATINFGSNVTNLYEKGTPSVDDTFVVNLSPEKGEEVTYFDLTQITANYTTTASSTATIKNKDLTITVTDAAGKTVDADTLKTSGTYYVTASVADTFDGQFVAGSQTVKVVVTYANPGENNVFVTYNGQNVDTTQDLKLEFTGKDQAADLSYLVKNASGDTLVEGKDYEIVITAIKDGKIAQVDEIVDAGDYTVTVKGLSYTGDVQFVVVVNPATVTKITPDYDYEAYLTYVYTGDVITPTYKFGKSTGAKQLTSDDYDVYYVMAYDKDGKAVEHPSGIDYTDASVNGSVATDHENQFSTLDATDLKEEGTYYAYFKLKDGVTNFKISDAAQGVEIRVSSERVFLDVPNGEWYTNYVYNANKAGYVYGYNNTKFFGPNDEIKRGDVVVILARMAGFSNVTAEDSTNELRGYLSNFDDVDNGTYYAHAIAWANKVGIVTGTSATTFEPERSVTREEFATMLQRYANLCEDGGAVAASTATELAKYTDGTSVCDWAKDAVAWASENEIMTGYAGTSVLGAENTVTRAQVAKMVITYQPKALSDVYATLQ